MWSIERQQGLLNSFTPNSELHGADRIPNAFLYVSFDASNDILSEFDSKLKNALYEKDKGPRDLLPVEKHALLSLKFTDIGPISWVKEYTGYTLLVHFGISGVSDIELSDTKVDKVQFTCLDGGSVKVKMRISAHPEERQIGKLGTLIQQPIEFSLLPPDLQQKSIDDEDLGPAYNPLAGTGLAKGDKVSA